MARTRGAGLDAGGLPVLRLEILVVDAIHTERAFLHHAVGLVIFARAIGAGPGAELAADAGFGIDQHDAIFGALVACPRGADGDAGRLLTVQAGAWEVDDARLRLALLLHLIAVDAVEPGAGGIRAIGVHVVQGCGIALRVPLLAGGGAGLAADTGVEVDDETELFGGGWRKRRHVTLVSVFMVANCGSLTPDWSDAFSTRTRRSYQAAWPVTGSLLE